MAAYACFLSFSSPFPFLLHLTVFFLNFYEETIGSYKGAYG